MTDLPQRMMEAMARAMWRHRWQAYMEAIDDLEWADRAWLLQPMDTHQRYEGFARASLRAALALAEAEGVGLFKVPKQVFSMSIHGDGRNAAIREMLAGRVEV